MHITNVNNMYKIAQTRKEKLEVVMYWDNMRKIAAEIRDEFDIIKENKYCEKILESLRKIELNSRPDFMEPLKVLSLKIVQECSQSSNIYGRKTRC
jgi:hypothetical protein